jgi:hypothetical protein
MSLTFSNIITKIDNACGTNTTSYSLANKAIDVNLALDEALATIFSMAGVWQFDDKNHTADPIVTTNLVDGQRDYHFTTDEQSNVILDILKVQAKNGSTGTYEDLELTDMQRITTETMTDGSNSEGTPTKYALTGNGIFLDLVPSYNSTNGLRIFINREASYFTSSDTTKVAGIDGLCHDFLYLKPAYEYARDKSLSNKETLFRDLQVATQKLKDRYTVKERITVHRIIPLRESNR